MKKIVYLLVLAFILIGCNNDDNVNDLVITQEPCKCDARFKEEGMQGFYVVQDVELNCETYQPISVPIGSTFLGCDERNIP